VLLTRPVARAAGRSAFTLVEMLAVLVIITILFTFVINKVMRGEDIVRVENTRQFIQQLSAIISEYEQERGDYPPSTFPSKMETKPSGENQGAEMLFLSLFSKDRSAREIDENRLANTDGDRAKNSLSSFTSTDVFEIVDDWQNPIAYTHRRDYGKSRPYVTFDGNTGEPHDALLKGRVSPKTGDPFNKSTFQLLSAGPDGIFETEDDIGNFSTDP
jgi:prepilin-type N-terminal cleavage/methylation domain-containing protein